MAQCFETSDQSTKKIDNDKFVACFLDFYIYVVDFSSLLLSLISHTIVCDRIFDENPCTFKSKTS